MFRLSPHITFGTISIKSIISKIENNNNENNLDKNPFIHLKKISVAPSFIQKRYDEPKIEFENLHPLYNNLRSESFNASFIRVGKRVSQVSFLDACLRFLKAKVEKF